MRAAASLTVRVRCPLAGSIVAFCCLVAAACAQAQSPAGIYQGHAPAADAAKRVFTLNLAQDGTAIFYTLYIGKDSVTQHGRWLESGGEIVLTFDPMGPNQPPRPITFRHRDHKLSPVRWDASEWGRAGPPVLHRSRSKTISAWSLADPSAASAGGG